MKSIIQLERIFMVDVSQKGIFKVSMELVLHFVNESRNPGTLPKIKKYYMGVSTDSKNTTLQKTFLRDLERASMLCSPYYRRMKRVKT